MNFFKIVRDIEKKGTLLDIAKKWLKSNDFEFRIEEGDDGHSYIKAGYAGDNGKFLLVIDSIEKSQLFIVYVYYRPWSSFSPYGTVESCLLHGGSLAGSSLHAFWQRDCPSKLG